VCCYEIIYCIVGLRPLYNICSVYKQKIIIQKDSSTFHFLSY